MSRHDHFNHVHFVLFRLELLWIMDTFVVYGLVDTDRHLHVKCNVSFIKKLSKEQICTITDTKSIYFHTDMRQTYKQNPGAQSL